MKNWDVLRRSRWKVIAGQNKAAKEEEDSPPSLPRSPASHVIPGLILGSLEAQKKKEEEERKQKEEKEILAKEAADKAAAEQKLKDEDKPSLWGSIRLKNKLAGLFGKNDDEAKFHSSAAEAGKFMATPKPWWEGKMGNQGGRLTKLMSLHKQNVLTMSNKIEVQPVEEGEPAEEPIVQEDLHALEEFHAAA